MQFPSAAQYPAQGMEAPIITSCISYAAQPCDSSALTNLGDVTFDATRPTLTITKVSEQFGIPTTTTPTRRLQQTDSSQPLFALMLFNFSKSGVLSSPALKHGVCKENGQCPVHHMSLVSIRHVRYDTSLWGRLHHAHGVENHCSADDWPHLSSCLTQA